LDSIRLISSLADGSPAFTIFIRPDFWSSRRSALRFLASGPWQAKQRSERIGRTSRRKSTRSAAVDSDPRNAAARMALTSVRGESNLIGTLGWLVGGWFAAGGTSN